MSRRLNLQDNRWVPDNRRLLFIAPSAYPLGGLATWLDYLLPGLEERGWEPSLGLVAGKHHDPDRYLAGHPYHRVLRIANRTGSQEGRVRALCRAIRSVDPAIALSVNIPDLYLAMVRLRSSGRSGARTAMTLHGIQSDLLGDAYAFRTVLDAVVCTNKLTCELVREVAEVPEERIHYAPYGVEVPENPRRAERSATGNRPIRIAWVGRLEEEQKRVSDLPRILKALERRGQPFELWVVGSGPDEAALRNQLAFWLEKGEVWLFGELPRERVFQEIYARADCFLLTSSWETGPIVIWEAMAAGLPVVTSEYVGSGPEGSLEDDENCLMFPVGDAEAAAECICTLFDAHRCEQLAAGGRRLVEDRYSIAASVQAWHAVLNAITQARCMVGNSIGFSTISSGRLDHWLGTRIAEIARQLLGVRFSHSSAGGEWPHSISEPRAGKH